MHSSTYSIMEDIPFSVYGESLIILTQNILIVLLFWVYSKSIRVEEKVGLFTFFTGYAFLLFSGYKSFAPEV